MPRQGAPGGGEYDACIRALYTVAGALPEPHAAPLEGRWWVEDTRPALEVPRAEWRWHLFLRQPVRPASPGQGPDKG